VEQVSAKNPKLTFPQLRDLLPQSTVGGSNLDEAGKQEMVTWSWASFLVVVLRVCDDIPVMLGLPPAALAETAGTGILWTW
jgi:hypothetical protein